MASERGAMLLASMRRAVRLCVGLASVLCLMLSRAATAVILSRTSDACFEEMQQRLELS